MNQINQTNEKNQTNQINEMNETNQTNQMSLAARVREALKERGMFKDSRDIAFELGVESKRVRWALKDMKRRGEVVKKDGWWVFVEKPLRARTREVARRIWRAMRLSAMWTIRDVVRLAETKEGTVKRYLKAWRKAGHIERVALRREGSWTVAVYRLRDRDRREPPPTK